MKLKGGLFMKDKTIKTFSVPVVWSMGGYVKVEADSKEEALEKAKMNLNDFELPIDCGPYPRVSYVEDSFELSDDDDEVMLDLIKEVDESDPYFG